MVRTNYPCARKSCSSHQSTLSTVRERKLLNSCSATTVRLSCPKILSCTKAAGNYATKYLFVFFNQRAWDGVWFVFSKYAVLCIFKSILKYGFHFSFSIIPSFVVLLLINWAEWNPTDAQEGCPLLHKIKKRLQTWTTAKRMNDTDGLPFLNIL